MIFSANGLDLYYEAIGKGPAVVMLHGNGEDGTIFRPLAGKLSLHHTLYILDSRNHGRSGRSEDYSYEAMASDIVAFIFALGLGNAGVIGFSDGAIVALKAQMSSPSLFGKMALLGANLSPADFRPELYAKMQIEYEKEKEPLLNLMLTQPHLRPSDLYGMDVPVLVVGAENDIFFPDTFTTITDSLPKARLNYLYGHDHESYIVNSDIMYEPLKDFFRIQS